MFKWLLFFVLILAAILAFVSWVMGVPIPGFSAQFSVSFLTISASLHCHPAQAQTAVRCVQV